MKPILLSIAILATTAAGLSAARAADPEFCARYARVAVQQAHLNYVIPGCYDGDSVRWTENYDAHFSWCLRVPRDGARIENERRAEKLRYCRVRAYGHS